MQFFWHDLSTGPGLLRQFTPCANAPAARRWPVQSLLISL